METTNKKWRKPYPKRYGLKKYVKKKSKQKCQKST